MELRAILIYEKVEETMEICVISITIIELAGSEIELQDF
jgi:hypothetical protein